MNNVRRSTITMLAVVLTACGSGSTGASTTVVPATVTTTTTGEPSTSTSSTSTTAPTTTTTSQPPTTSTTLLEGTWAELPLVAYDDWGGIALGWWDGSAWVQVDADTELPVSGGEDYQVALLGSEAIVVGSETTHTGCDIVAPEGMPGVQFDDEDVLSFALEEGPDVERTVSGVAVSAPWQITPRPVGPGEAHPDIEAMAAGLLAERGFETDRVELVQSVDADLDGDGALESIFVAEETELANEASGVYSVVFAVSPSWSAPLVVAESVIASDDAGFPASFRVSAVADLSGDGVMEVVVDGLAWENGWVSVHELSEGEFAERITAGCGV